MTEAMLVVDPGESTGWSLWFIDPDRPVQLVEYGLVQGGVDGWIDWMESHLGIIRPDVWVVEKFNTNDGRVGRADLEPLLIEGAIKAVASALALEVTWQYNLDKDQCSDALLKEHGLYIMSAQSKVDPAIMWTDARDVNDTFRHALARAKMNEHMPTIEAFWPEA